MDLPFFAECFFICKDQGDQIGRNFAYILGDFSLWAEFDLL
jgi:hypothetical protein